MPNLLFARPIGDSPREDLHQHRELVPPGRPTGNVVDRPRCTASVTPTPKPKKPKGKDKQEEVLDKGLGLTTKKRQARDLTWIINEVRSQVAAFHNQVPNRWQITPETARPLRPFDEPGGVRPLLCHVEAVEMAIWLSDSGKKLLDARRSSSHGSRPHASISGRRYLGRRDRCRGKRSNGCS